MADEMAMRRKGAVIGKGDILFMRFAVARVLDQRSPYLTEQHFQFLPIPCDPTAGFSLYCGPITRPHHCQVNIVASPKREHVAQWQSDKQDGYQPKASAPTRLPRRLRRHTNDCYGPNNTNDSANEAQQLSR
jgi:hypothetical protein